MHKLIPLLAAVLIASLTCTDNPTAALETEPVLTRTAGTTAASTSPSAIVTLLLDDESGLNSVVFAISVMTYLLDDATAEDAFEIINFHKAGNGSGPLSAEEEDDIRRMKDHYRRLNHKGRGEYLDKLPAYSQLLTEEATGIVTVEWWDENMGLASSHPAMLSHMDN